MHMAALRKALSDGQAGNRFILNISGRGYSFVAPVIREPRHETAAPPNQAVRAGNLWSPLMRVIGRDDITASVARRVHQ